MENMMYDEDMSISSTDSQDSERNYFYNHPNYKKEKSKRNIDENLSWN